MTPPKISPDAMLCFDVYALNQAFGRLYKPLLAPLGLTYPQYLVMIVLWERKQATVTEIGARVGLETNTLTPLIKRLEGAGLVTRRRDVQDERRVNVALTGAGAALAARAQDIPACVEAATGMSEEAITVLRRQLAQLRAALVNG